MKIVVASGCAAFIDWCSEALLINGTSGMGIGIEDARGSHVVHPSTEPLDPKIARVAARITTVQLAVSVGTDPYALTLEEIRTAAFAWLTQQRRGADSLRSSIVAAYRSMHAAKREAEAYLSMAAPTGAQMAAYVRNRAKRDLQQAQLLMHLILEAAPRLGVEPPTDE